MTTEIIATQGFGAAKRLDDGRYRIIVSGEAEADLAMRAPELLEENEALKKRIEELEGEAEVISAEFEGELWKGVRRILLNECGLDYGDFPLTADEAIESIKNEMDQRASDRDRLRDRIAELEAEQEWRPIEDVPFNKPVILLDAKTWAVASAVEVNRGHRIMVDPEHMQATHFMEMPKVPTPETPTV